MTNNAPHMSRLLNRARMIAFTAAVEELERQDRERIAREQERQRWLYQRQREAEQARERIAELMNDSRQAEIQENAKDHFRAFVSERTKGKRRRGGKKSRRRPYTIPGTGVTVLTRRRVP